MTATETTTQAIQLSVLSRLERIIYYLLSVVGFVVVVAFARAWIAAHGWRYSPAAFLLGTALAAMLLSNQLVRWVLLPFMRRVRPGPVPRLRVAVVTAFVPSAEPLEMLEVTLGSMVALDVPHDTWVLDEGNDPAVRALCERMGALHFSRKDRAEYHAASGQFATRSKHGNYNAWLAEVGFRKYDVLSAFDVDHVPERGFLREVLGHFSRPQVGYVQAAQAYYNQGASMVARGAAEETYEFYSVVQMSNNRLGYPAVIGCHNTHRIQALKSAGGYAAHDADDLLLTMRYRQSGWEGVYVPAILARGLAPADWASYLIQQRRWCRAVLDLKLRRQWSQLTGLGMRQRAAALLHGLNFIQPGVMGLAEWRC